MIVIPSAFYIEQTQSRECVNRHQHGNAVIELVFTSDQRAEEIQLPDG